MLIYVACLYRWSIVIGLVFVVLANLVAWVLSPKGEDRTLVSFLQSYLERCGTNRGRGVAGLDWTARRLVFVESVRTKCRFGYPAGHHILSEI